MLFSFFNAAYYLFFLLKLHLKINKQFITRCLCMVFSFLNYYWIKSDDLEQGCWRSSIFIKANNTWLIILCSRLDGWFVTRCKLTQFQLCTSQTTFHTECLFENNVDFPQTYWMKEKMGLCKIRRYLNLLCREWNIPRIVWKCFFKSFDNLKNCIYYGLAWNFCARFMEKII